MEETELTEDEAWLSSLGQAPANRPRQPARVHNDRCSGPLEAQLTLTHACVRLGGRACRGRSGTKARDGATRRGGARPPAARGGSGAEAGGGGDDAPDVEALRARSDALRIAHDIAEVSLVEAGEARGIIATAEGRRARQVGEAVGETLASLEATRVRLANCVVVAPFSTPSRRGTPSTRSFSSQ
eukprot:scaffold23106_cov30-Tisochrysis_lutea.AAC.3